MKSKWKFALLWCLLPPLCAQADTDDIGAGVQTFHFNNGAGLYGSSSHYQFDSRHGSFHPYNGTPVSRFFVHRRLDGGVLHYGGTVAGDERHHYGGFTTGPATLAYFHGEGESFSKAPNPVYDDLDQYFFHGGSRAPFTIQGMGANVRLGGGLSAQLAVSNVSAPGTEDRVGYYAGVSNRSVEAGVFEVDRDGEKVGHGLNLRFDIGGLDLGYQELRSDYDAHVRRVSLAWSDAPTRSFSIDLEQADNNLFSRDDDQRIMFRFRKRLGRVPTFSAAEGGEGGDGTEKEGFNRAAAIGIGVGVAAIAISSGGDSDGAQRFSVRNDAAFSVLNRINPVSVRENREHGGWVFRNADNTFGYTDPVAGTVSSVNIGNPVSAVPSGTAASASYHTHGGPDPRFDNENFSPQDILSDNLARTDGYLGTPAGFMKLHDFRAGTISVVGRINN